MPAALSRDKRTAPAPGSAPNGRTDFRWSTIPLTARFPKPRTASEHFGALQNRRKEIVSGTETIHFLALRVARNQDMFIRFVTPQIDRASGQRQGLFQAAKTLRETGALNGPDHEHLEYLRSWFNERLETPTRLAVSSRPHKKAQAISLFKDTATEHIAKMRELQEILERYGIGVQMIRAKRLGYVLYEDEFQVAAYPFNDTPT
jgi:hypothetical protein